MPETREVLAVKSEHSIPRRIAYGIATCAAVGSLVVADRAESQSMENCIDNPNVPNIPGYPCEAEKKELTTITLSDGTVCTFDWGSKGYGQSQAEANSTAQEAFSNPNDPKKIKTAQERCKKDNDLTLIATLGAAAALIAGAVIIKKHRQTI